MMHVNVVRGFIKQIGIKEMILFICWRLTQTKNKVHQIQLNVLMIKIESCCTAGLRSECGMKVSLDDHTDDVVSFPRLHFCISSVAPLIHQTCNNNNNNDNNESITKVLKYRKCKYNKSLVDGFIRLNYTIATENKLLLYDELMNVVYKFYCDKCSTQRQKYYDVRDAIALCELIFGCDYFMVDLSPIEFEPCQDKCMAVRMQRRGNSINPNDRNNYKLMSACQYLKENTKVTFIQFTQNGFICSSHNLAMTSMKYLTFFLIVCDWCVVGLLNKCKKKNFIVVLCD